MSGLRLLLVIAVSAASAASMASAAPSEDNVDWEYEDEVMPVYDPFEARSFVNVTLGDIFNSSILGIGGGLILAIILFELALYALDVYYNKTYGFGGSSYGSGGGGGGGYGGSSGGFGGSGGGSSYGRVDNPQDYLPLLYREKPKYRDPFVDTFRALHGDSVFTKILAWIDLAKDTYETGNEAMGDLNCQKKLICEVYQDWQFLGELSARARHSLDGMGKLADLGLADEIVNTIDEFQEARDSAAGDTSCQDLYPACPKSLLQLKGKFDAI